MIWFMFGCWGPGGRALLSDRRQTDRLSIRWCFIRLPCAVTSSLTNKAEGISHFQVFISRFAARNFGCLLIFLSWSLLGVSICTHNYRSVGTGRGDGMSATEELPRRSVANEMHLLSTLCQPAIGGINHMLCEMEFFVAREVLQLMGEQEEEEAWMWLDWWTSIPRRLWSLIHTWKIE